MENISVNVSDDMEISLEQLDLVNGGSWGKVADVVIKVVATGEAIGKIYEAGKKVKAKVDDVISGLVC